MSVYINGMEIPENCALCPMWDAGDCLTASEAIICEYDKRPQDCPLAPVPPHGDLIDRAALRAEVKKHATPSDAWVFSLIRTAPTIIPADKEET